jgi:hypothetical protein
MQFNCQHTTADRCRLNRKYLKKIKIFHVFTAVQKKKQDQALVSFCQLAPSQCLNLLFYATKFNYGTGCLACAMLCIDFFYINFFKKIK